MSSSQGRTLWVQLDELAQKYRKARAARVPIPFNIIDLSNIIRTILDEQSQNDRAMVRRDINGLVGSESTVVSLLKLQRLIPEVRELLDPSRKEYLSLSDALIVADSPVKMQLQAAQNLLDGRGNRQKLYGRPDMN